MGVAIGGGGAAGDSALLRAGIANPRPIVGRARVVPTPANTTTAMALNVLYAVPFTWDGTPIDQIGIEVTVAGDAGSVIRLGIAAPRTDYDTPGAITEFGSVTSASTGRKLLTITHTPARGLNFALAVGQTWTTTAPTVRTCPVTNAALSFASADTALDGKAYTESSVSGAMPANFAAAPSTGTLAPAFILRHA